MALQIVPVRTAATSEGLYFGGNGLFSFFLSTARWHSFARQSSGGRRVASSRAADQFRSTGQTDIMGECVAMISGESNECHSPGKLSHTFPDR